MLLFPLHICITYAIYGFYILCIININVEFPYTINKKYFLKLMSVSLYMKKVSP